MTTEPTRPPRQYRFGDFVGAVSVRQRRISFNRVVAMAEAQRETQGRIALPPRVLLRVLRPYVSVRFTEQFKAVIPLALYLALFQVVVLKAGVSDPWTIGLGLSGVIVGLMLFLEGLKQGLMPFGETIGSILPVRSPLPVVLIVTLLLGVGVTFAEPAIGALKAAGATVSPDKAPYLSALLNQWSDVLVFVVGGGVGLAAVLGTLRFLYGWSLKPLIYSSMAVALGLTIYAMRDPHLAQVLGLAWDCGAVTTGPVTVPLVLALGIGVASAGGRGDSSLSGFGIVTLASIFPVIGVLGLALFVASRVSAEELSRGAGELVTKTDPGWWEVTPGVEVVLGVRAIVPLVLFLLLVMKVLLRERVNSPGTIAYGITLAVVGMIIFNLGLSYGLAKLGTQSGSLVPAAFVRLDVVGGSPLYGPLLGVLIAVGFALLLGFGATLAEPALSALGTTVEKLTNGAFRSSMLMMAVAVGVGLGIALGVVKIIWDLPLAWLVLPGYALALILTFFSSEEFVNVAWDSAGVTTGPVTVPLVLAMGLGLGSALEVVDGFGILSMASICPIVCVLALGLVLRFMTWYRHFTEDRRAERETEEQRQVTL